MTWPTKKLGEILKSIESGYRPKGGVRHIREGVPSIGAEHLTSSGGFNFEKIKYIPRDFFEKLNRGIIRHGDVLVVKDGATTGRVSLVTNDFPFDKSAVNEHVFILRPNTENILSEFLFNFLFSEKGQRQILQTFHGMAQGGIDSKFVNFVEIPLPPLSEQKKIVEKIEKLFAKIDEAERLRAETLAASAALLPSAFHQVFNRAKKENWPIKKLGEVCQIQKGKKPHLYQESDPGRLPYLTAEALRNGIAKQFASISDRNSVRVSEKEIIVICDGSNSGDVFFGHNGTLASTMGKLVHSQEIYTKYLYLFLKQNFGYLNTDKIGAATPHLNQEKFKNLEIPLPPLPEQKRIVAYLDTLSQKSQELQKLQQQTAADFSALRQSILVQAFNQNW